MTCRIGSKAERGRPLLSLQHMVTVCFTHCLQNPPCRQLQMILEGDTIETDNGSGAGAEEESMPVARSSGPVSSLFPYVFVGSVGLNGGVVLRTRAGIGHIKQRAVC